MNKIKKTSFKNHWPAFLGILIFAVIVTIMVFFLWNPTIEETGLALECKDVNGAASYTFDACFDLTSKTIFLNVRRSQYDSYNLNAIDIVYFDTKEINQDLVNLPPKGGTRIYYLDSSKNPRNIYISLGVEKDFIEPICQVPKRIFVRDCGAGVSNNINIGTTGKETPKEIDLRTHLLELEQKEEAWKTKCESSWKCSGWEICEAGIQKRICTDLNNCFIPTKVPSTGQYCSDTCLEDWKCTWSRCLDGKTNPECIDNNQCGTTFNKPESLNCDFESICTPEVECTGWSSCNVDYNLIDLTSKDIKNLLGTMTRVCVDKNSCVEPLSESKNCSTSIDVFTSRYTKCGVEYIEIYNQLDENLVARLDIGTKENPRLNIRLDGGKDEIYCDYCYNGILDGDEANIDCGGSCESCEKKSGQINLGSTSIFSKIGDFFKNLF